MGKYPDSSWQIEFARRAKRNLDVIMITSETYKDTQSILTLFSLVLIPQEGNVFNDAKDLTKTEMLCSRWPLANWHWKAEKSLGRTPDGLRALLFMIRNCLAHGHFEFLDDGKSITGVRFNHCYPRRNPRNHICGEWSVKDLFTVIERVLELFENKS